MSSGGLPIRNIVGARPIPPVGGTGGVDRPQRAGDAHGVGVTGSGAGVAVARRGRAGGNPYGFGWALGGIAAGFVLSVGALGGYMAARGFHHGSGGFGGELVDLVGLWLGFAGAAVLAVWSHPPSVPFRLRPALARAFGFSLRLWPDVPLGVACGVAAQYLLVPALEWPLSPFVPHLYHRIAEPANSLVAHVHGPGLVVLGLFICLGSPIVEELYFRGLLLRSLIGGWRRPAGAGRRAAGGLGGRPRLRAGALRGAGVPRPRRVRRAARHPRRRAPGGSARGSAPTSRSTSRRSSRSRRCTSDAQGGTGRRRRSG